jgi:hypothetical protein
MAIAVDLMKLGARAKMDHSQRQSSYRPKDWDFSRADAVSQLEQYLLVTGKKISLTCDNIFTGQIFVDDSKLLIS